MIEKFFTKKARPLPHNEFSLEQKRKLLPNQITATHAQFIDLMSEILERERIYSRFKLDPEDLAYSLRLNKRISDLPKNDDDLDEMFFDLCAGEIDKNEYQAVVNKLYADGQAVLNKFYDMYIDTRTIPPRYKTEGKSFSTEGHYLTELGTVEKIRLMGHELDAHRFKLLYESERTASEVEKRLQARLKQTPGPAP